MIVVKVELWPHGDAEKAEPLGVVAVANQGSAGKDSDLFRYDVQLQRSKGAPIRGHFTHWRRRGWLHLVRLALEAVDYHG